MKSYSNDKMMTLNFLQLIVHMRTSDNKDLFVIVYIFQQLSSI